jgi:hypothetical protein
LIAAVRRKLDAPLPQAISPPAVTGSRTPGIVAAPTASPINLGDVVLGLAIDTSGSMQESIRNDTGRVMSRLEGIQDAIRDMGASLQSQLQSRAVVPHSIKLFAYAFGLRHGDACDLISMVRASKEMDIAAEAERLKQKYEAEARRSASQYSDLVTDS